VTRAAYRGPWRVDLTVRDGVAVPIAGNALARAVADALDAGQAPSPASIGLILSDDAELATLNEAHLGMTGATDVLSFPLLSPDAFPDHPGAGPRAAALVQFALPPGRRTHVGDIVISVERAIAQAEAGRGGQTGDIRWSPADELRLLAIHGTLHVCGWDHADPTEEVAMRALERRVLGTTKDRSLIR
jgi:probable rRNA maturation factor